jgi:putrescine oxidase
MTKKYQELEMVKTVVVVGAGAAGLQAANILLENEAFHNGRMDVIVLEARDRVGGRLFIDNRWGIPFDLGIISIFQFIM